MKPRALPLPDRRRSSPRSLPAARRIGDPGLRAQVRLQLHDVPLVVPAPQRLRRRASATTATVLPGHGATEKTILESPTPVAMRTSAGYVFDEFKHAPAAPFQRGFEVVGLDVLSAGLLGKKIGYMLIFVPGITESRGVAGQEAALEMANVVFREHRRAARLSCARDASSPRTWRSARSAG